MRQENLSNPVTAGGCLSEIVQVAERTNRRIGVVREFDTALVGSILKASGERVNRQHWRQQQEEIEDRAESSQGRREEEANDGKCGENSRHY